MKLCLSSAATSGEGSVTPLTTVRVVADNFWRRASASVLGLELFLRAPASSSCAINSSRSGASVVAFSVLRAALRGRSPCGSLCAPKLSDGTQSKAPSVIVRIFFVDLVRIITSVPSYIPSDVVDVESSGGTSESTRCKFSRHLLASHVPGEGAHAKLRQ